MALLRTIPCSTQLYTKQHFEFENKKHSSINPFFSSSSSFHSPLRVSISHHHTPTTTLIRTKQHSNSTLTFTSTSEQVTTQEQEQQQQDTEEQNEEEEEEVSPTKLFVQNFPWTSTAEDVRNLFEKYGKVVDVELSRYSKNRHMGYAFVEMGSPEEALAALNSLQSYEFEGRVIIVKYARLKTEKTLPRTLFVGNLSYKTSSKDLREFFDSGTSKVVSADVVFRENPRRPGGRFGFVSFKSEKEADEALSEFQGKILLGRPIRVAPGKRIVKLTEKSKRSEDTSSESSVNEVAEVNKAD